MDRVPNETDTSTTATTAPLLHTASAVGNEAFRIRAAHCDHTYEEFCKEVRHAAQTDQGSSDDSSGPSRILDVATLCVDTLASGTPSGTSQHFDVTLTLRILSLLDRVVGDVEGVLDRIIKVGLGVWVGVVPQLFARVFSVENEATGGTQLAERVLVGLAEEFPQAVLYHVVAYCNGASIGEAQETPSVADPPLTFSLFSSARLRSERAAELIPKCAPHVAQRQAHFAARMLQVLHQSNIFSVADSFAKEMVKITETYEDELVGVLTACLQFSRAVEPSYARFILKEREDEEWTPKCLTRQAVAVKLRELLKPILRYLTVYAEYVVLKTEEVAADRKKCADGTSSIASHAALACTKLHSFLEAVHSTVFALSTQVNALHIAHNDDTSELTIPEARELLPTAALNHLIHRLSMLLKEREGGKGDITAPYAVQKKTDSEGVDILQVALSDISPVLHLGMTHGVYGSVPIPQCSAEGTNDNRILRVDGAVTILATRTRPKKIGVWSSKGEHVRLLLKGKDDLSFDTLVLQVMRHVNNALKTRSPQKWDRITTYDVVILGYKAGVVRLVENVEPIFHCHRRWIKHRAEVKEGRLEGDTTSPSTGRKRKAADKPGAANNDDGGSPPRFRPVARFYETLFPLLRQALGDTYSDTALLAQRALWPEAVLTKVFQQLSSEVPHDLLRKEIFYAAGLVPRCSNTNTTTPGIGFQRWLSATQNYTASLATMSAVGYVLGIGDRHLDNILIDLSTGGTLHIDYSVSLDKGLALKVPECVPFRLTNSVRGGLGFAGVEGGFVQVCADTLAALRTEQNSVMNILSTFSHRPPLEWVTHPERSRDCLFLVNQRLQGLDNNETESPEQQARRIIRAATSTDNLKRMYEGWTPWV